MNELLAAHAAYLKEERMRSPGTVARYSRVLSAFAAFVREGRTDNGVPLDRVEKGELAQFLRAGRAEPSRAVFNARLAALRSFYEYLFKMEKIAVNPALRIDRLKMHSRSRVPLSLDEVFRLVDAMKTADPAYRARNVAIVEMLFHTSLRVSELASLNVEQVDFQNRLLLSVRTKGDKRLSIPFNDIVAAALEAYLPDRTRLAGDGATSALLLSDRGVRMGVRTVQALLRRYGTRAGISRPVTPHLLRHSSVTELAAMGTPLSVVQSICNHASITTTQRYVHVGGEARRTAVDALGKRWRERSDRRGDTSNLA